jgi:hypothetical protein
LELVDARPMKRLRETKKTLEKKHLADGRLQLTVRSDSDVAPIPTGELVELVFSRRDTRESTIAFAPNLTELNSLSRPVRGKFPTTSDPSFWDRGCVHGDVNERLKIH